MFRTSSVELNRIEFQAKHCLSKFQAFVHYDSATVECCSPSVLPEPRLLSQATLLFQKNYSTHFPSVLCFDQ